jgi:hypothetical protein
MDEDIESLWEKVKNKVEVASPLEKHHGALTDS